tara:strand:- start:8462 stop:10138 length:1677 start_codon:yes stop_codon:yes gene_type:complete
MALDKIGVEIEVKSKGAAKAIADVTKGLGDFNEELSRNREGMQVLDQLTGGAVSQFQDYSSSVKGGIKAVKGLSTSFKGLRTAIVATGIGAIVIALGLIVAYWDDIIELVSGVSKEQKDLLALQEESVAASQMQYDNINATSNTLKLQGKSERDILNAKKLQTDETIRQLEAQLITQKEIKDSQVETAKRNRNILQGIISFITLPITLLLGSVDAITQTLAQLGILDEGTGLAAGFTGGIAELVFDPEDVAAKGDETIAETQKQLQKLKNTRDGFILQKQKEDADAEQKRKDDEAKKQKEIDDKTKAEQDALDKLKADSAKKDADLKRQQLQSIENLENEYFNRLLDKQTIEENAVREKYFNLIEAARQYGEDTSVLEEAQSAELKAIKDKADAEDIARDKTLKKQQLSSMSDTFGQVANILGKKSAAGKAAAIAAATINTYQGISEVWGNESTLPSPFDVIQKAVASATVLASGLKTVQQIKSVPKPAGVTGGGGGGGGTPTFTPPAFNVVGASGSSQLADAIGGQSNQPTRAYVVSDDVTTSQALERNIVDGATIG